jgi:Listeria-Bacteroides repeat domain (List_Bact_rpt).
MKKFNAKFFKMTMKRGISLLLCLTMMLSIVPMHTNTASAAPYSLSPIYDTGPDEMYYIEDTGSEYKASGEATDFMMMTYSLYDKSWNDDQLAMLQSGGAEVTFSFDAWTGLSWSWYSYYLTIYTTTSDSDFFPTDPPVATVNCVEGNFPFYENKGYWQTRTFTLPLAANTNVASITGHIIQPRNYDPAWGNRDYGWHDQNAFKNLILRVDFVGTNYPTLVKTNPVASTIISGQTLDKSTLSGGKVVTTAANANVSNPAALTGSFSWQNASQLLMQLTSTTTVRAIFTPFYNKNFATTTCDIEVPVRAAVITLNPNGGWGGSSSADGWYGSKPANIAVPTQTGYGFKGYYSAASGGTQYYDASGTAVKNWDIAADTTLYAQWEKQCTISNISSPAAITTGSKLALTTPTVTGAPTSQGWQYSTNGSSGWTDFDPSSKTFSVSENGNYLRYYATNGAGPIYSNMVQITVNKYAPALSISATPTSATYPANVILSATLTGADSVSGKPIKFYDGASYLGTSNTDASGKATYTVTSPTAAEKSYKAMFDGDTYNVSASSSALGFTVSKGTQSAVSFASTSDILKTYGDTAFTLPTVSGGSGTGAYSYRSSDTAVATVSGNTVTIKGAGEANIYVKKLGDTNYNDSSEVSLKVKVSRKAVTISGMGANNKVYDGTDAASLNTTNAVINGIINSDSVSIDTTDAVASFSDKNAAADKPVTFTGLALSGSGSANYILSSQPASVTSTITPKSITVSGITAKDKTYDGNYSATLQYTGVTLNGKISGDDLGVTATGTYTNKNSQAVATTVNITGLTLGGTSVDNYVLSATGQQATTTAKITPATITVTPNSGQYKYYGQSDPSLAYSSSGAIDSETPSFVGALSRAAGDVIANNYAIGIGTLGLSNNGSFLASNYQLGLNANEVSFEIKGYPTSAVATAVPNGQNGWHQSGPITLTAPTGYQISTSNALSGNTWTNEITLDNTDGINKSTTYYLKAISGADIGTISSPKTFNYNVDKTAPSDCKATYGSNTLFKILHTVTFGLFFKETATVTLEATDVTSGVDHFDVSFNGTPAKSDLTVNKSDGKFTFKINPQFLGNFTVSATDVAGNESTTTSFQNMSVDNKVPTTPKVTATSNGSSYTSGMWGVDDIELSASGSTADSGIAKYQYSIDGGKNWADMITTEATVATDTMPYNATKATITISTDQNTTYEIRAVSNSDLFSEGQNFDVKLDTTLPTIASVTGNATSWQNTDVTLTENASDNGSGLAEAAYSFDGGVNWQSDKTKVYNANQTIAANTIKVKDAVGHIQSYSAPISISKIDKGNPENPTVMLNGGTPSTGWYNSYPTIDITAPTYVPDTAPETTYYKLWNTSAATNNTEPASGTVLTAQPTLSDDGIWKLKTWTEDEAGNTSTPSTITIKVDSTTPDGDIKIGASSVKTFLNKITFGLLYKQNVDVTVTGTDATSGVAKVEYYKSTEVLDQQDVKYLTSQWSEYNGAITEKAVDSSKFIYYVKITDSANNVTYIASNGATFDTTKPAVTGIADGAVYYVDQAVAVTDTNLDTITLNGNSFASGNKLTGNVDATYDVSATDKAGNNTTVTVTMKPIGSLSTSIDLLSVDNVKSSDKAAIEGVRTNVEAALLATNNGASKAQIDALNAIIAKCNSLLTKIQDINDKVADVNTKTSGITTDTVKSSDKANLESVLSTINYLLATNNLTDGEKSALEKKKTEVVDALAKIKIIADSITDVNTKTNGITTVNVKNSDKTNLDSALSTINDLLATNNLTDSEKLDLEQRKTDVTNALAKITEVADKIADINTKTNGITTVNVKSSNKANLESALSTINDLLATNNLTDSEKSALEQKKTDVANALAKITEIVATITDINTKTSGITNETVKSSDKANLESALSTINGLLATNNLTDSEKTAFEQRKTDVANALAKITEISATITDINTKTNGITIEIVKSSDKANLDSALSTINGLLATNNLTDSEKSALEKKKTEVTDILARIKNVADSIADANTKTNGITIETVKSSDKANLDSTLSTINGLLATNNLTDSEKSALEKKKTEIINVLQRITEVQNEILKEYNSVKNITTDNVKKTDKTALEQAVNDLKNILVKDTNNFTNQEIQEIKGQINSIGIIISTLDKVAEVEALISNLPNEAEVTKADADVIAKANDAYKALTNHQKEIVDPALKTKLDNVINTLKKRLLFDAPTDTKIEGANGTVFDIRTELVVKPMINALDKGTMDRFALGVSSVAKDQEIAQLYDIKLLLNGQAIQPDGLVKITLALTPEQANYKDLKIVYIADDGRTTIIPSTRNGKEISFITNHFSYYGIIGTPIKKTNSNHTPKTGDNTPVIPLMVLSILTFLSSVILAVVTKKRKQRALKK